MVRYCWHVRPCCTLPMGGNKSVALDGICGMGCHSDVRSDKGGKIACRGS